MHLSFQRAVGFLCVTGFALFALLTSVHASIIDSVRGYILLQVEQHGEAWYVPPDLETRYYLKDGTAAYEALRAFGLGITDADLATIPVAGETASSATTDSALVDRVSGYILLQVEQHGEAWCVHPKTGTRTYMEDGDAAYTIMRQLSLGITDADLEQISIHEDSIDPNASTDGSTVAFFYQYVGALMNGVGDNGVRLGLTTDSEAISTSLLEALDWEVRTIELEASDETEDEEQSYGDPVFSRLSNGNWAMTSWSGSDDPRGANVLLYHESECPVVDDDAVVAITASSESGCTNVRALTVGKTSQIFEKDGNDYVFHSNGGDVYLAQLTDDDQTALELDSLCVLSSPVDAFSELNYGESTKVLDGSDEGLLFSDTAIGQREDGTWVLFAKGIETDSGCTSTTLCELCGRSIYRATSSDLIDWSTPEEVVEQASVPEAYVANDGKIWLYHQAFSDVCDAQDQHLATIAPVTGHYEAEETYELSDPIRVEFLDEAFQTNSTIHYATNGNPVSLPDQEAVEALEACANM